MYIASEKTGFLFNTIKAAALGQMHISRCVGISRWDEFVRNFLHNIFETFCALYLKNNMHHINAKEDAFGVLVILQWNK